MYVVFVVLFFPSGTPIMSYVIQGCIYQVLLAYFMAHLSWFGVVKKHGCCWCCCIICIEGRILMLIWGVVVMLWGVNMILQALNLLGLTGCDLYFLFFIPYGLYGVTLIYLGFFAIMNWKAQGGEIPKANEVS